jgi:hypothetical protein
VPAVQAGAKDRGNLIGGEPPQAVDGGARHRSGNGLKLVAV